MALKEISVIDDKKVTSNTDMDKKIIVRIGNDFSAVSKSDAFDIMSSIALQLQICDKEENVSTDNNGKYKTGVNGKKRGNPGCIK